MANKYAEALAAFIAAKAKLYNRASAWPEYSKRIAESDAAWLTLREASEASKQQANETDAAEV